MQSQIKIKILFVGERRSATAQRRGWTWRDGRLAAVPLFEALRALGIDPRTACDFINLWTDDADESTILRSRVGVIRVQARRGVAIAALGSRVAAELTRLAIPHVALVHPAARGRIRRRDLYLAHVRERLEPYLATASAVPVAGGAA